MVASTILFRIHETALAGNNEFQGKKNNKIYCGSYSNMLRNYGMYNFFTVVGQLRKMSR